MFFDNITKQWSRNCPENAPSVPTPPERLVSTVQPTGVSPAAASGLKKPISSNDNNNNNKDAYSEAQKAGAAAIASAGLSQKVAPVGAMSQPAKKLKQALDERERTKLLEVQLLMRVPRMQMILVAAE